MARLILLFLVLGWGFKLFCIKEPVGGALERGCVGLDETTSSYNSGGALLISLQSRALLKALLGQSFRIAKSVFDREFAGWVLAIDKHQHSLIIFKALVV